MSGVEFSDFMHIFRLIAVLGVQFATQASGETRALVACAPGENQHAAARGSAHCDTAAPVLHGTRALAAQCRARVLSHEPAVRLLVGRADGQLMGRRRTWGCERCRISRPK